MGEIYRVVVKGEVISPSLNPTQFNEEEKRILRNGLFKESEDKKSLRRYYGINDPSLNLYIFFEDNKNIIFSDKVLSLIRSRIENFGKCLQIEITDFIWEEFRYQKQPRLTPGEKEFVFIKINSLKDTEIELTTEETSEALEI